MLSIEVFLDEDGKIKQYPVKRQMKLDILCYLSGKFCLDRDYTEKEVNEIIDAWHTFGDYFLLRRELIDYHFLNRTIDGIRYWKNKYS